MPGNQNGKIINKIKVNKKNAYVCFDDDSKIEISHNTLAEFNLYKNKRLSDKLIKDILKQDNFDALFQYSLNIANRYLCSEKKMIDKLKKKNAKDSDIKKIINKLKEYKLINEEDMVQSYLESSNHKCYGINKIKEGLYKKGINKYLIDKINISFDEEYKKAKKLVNKAVSKYDHHSNEEMKNKCYLYLIRYGYNHDVINKIISEVDDLDDNKELENLTKEYKKISRKDKDNNKMIKYLMSKGYKYKDINKIIKEN
mgnify:CR=1 FL=1